MLVRVPLTAAVLQGRNFTAADTQRVAFVLLGYAPAIWAYSMTHVLTRAFYARGDSMTPVKVGLAMVALNIALNLTLIWTPLKEAGFAWSTAICAVVQTLILLRLTRRYASHVIDRTVAASWLRSALMTLTMASMVWLVMSIVTPTPALAGTWRWAMIQLAVLVPVGLATAWMASSILRMPEPWWAMGKVGNRNGSSN
jgi:putative peptidoglycan lipid II flippase